MEVAAISPTTMRLTCNFETCMEAGSEMISFHCITLEVNGIFLRVVPIRIISSQRVPVGSLEGPLFLRVSFSWICCFET